jgi:ATP-dependent Clp protease adaptor protein ClpS
MSDSTVMDPTLKDKEKLENKKPKQYQVVFLNDDFTSMEFVTHMLSRYHGKNGEAAQKIMMEVHEKGKAIAGIYTHEIAETKVFLVNQQAKINQFPLKNIMEEVQ